MSREFVSTRAARAIAAPAGEVWGVLRRFEDLSWALGQGVAAFEATGSGVGMLRTAHAPNEGGRIVEKLTELDEDGMRLEYAIVEGGIPTLEDYVARTAVRPRGEGCEVEWQCRASVEAHEREQGQAILDAMADRMTQLFAAQFDA